MRRDDQGRRPPGGRPGTGQHRGVRGGDRGAGRGEEHQRHAQAGYREQQPAGCPAQTGHAGGQVAGPGQQAGHRQPEMGVVQPWRPAAAWPPGTRDPPGHHRQAQADGDEPGDERGQAERRPAGSSGRHRSRCRGRSCRGRLCRGHRRGLAGRRDGADQTGQVLAGAADELTLPRPAAYPGRGGSQRLAYRHVYLGLAQPPACCRNHGHRDVTPDRARPELSTRRHRARRSRGLTRAPGPEDGTRHRQDQCRRHFHRAAAPPRARSSPGSPGNARQADAHGHSPLMHSFARDDTQPREPSGLPRGRERGDSR